MEDQGILVRVLKTLQLKIDVQRGPVKVAVVKQIHVQDVAHRGFLEPGKLLVVEKILPPTDKNPNSMRGDVQHFSG